MTKKTNTEAAGQSKVECCMCGDCGFSEELFQCKVCQFRSQHRYCSNVYPKAEGYGTCNWCLIQKDDIKDKSLNSSNSSSSGKIDGSTEKINSTHIRHLEGNNNNNKKKGGNGKVHVKNKGIHKLRSLVARSPSSSPPPPPPPPSEVVSKRKRIITNGGLMEERTKSEEDISNRSGMITRQIFRNKVRRYKLLDEVSS